MTDVDNSTTEQEDVNNMKRELLEAEALCYKQIRFIVKMRDALRAEEQKLEQLERRALKLGEEVEQLTSTNGEPNTTASAGKN